MRAFFFRFHYPNTPLTLNLSPRFVVCVLRDSLAGERGQKEVQGVQKRRNSLALGPAYETRSKNRAFTQTAGH